MIPLEIQQESKTPVLPVGSDKGSIKQEGSLSFAALLQGVKEDDKNNLVMQNGSLVLSLKNEEVSAKNTTSQKKTQETLLSLLNNTELNESQELQLEENIPQLNPKLSEELSSEELKQLVRDAKVYIQDKIKETDGFLRAEAASLPKTLKGLAQYAQKLGIDLSKITVEDLEVSGEEILQESPLSAKKSEAPANKKTSFESMIFGKQLTTNNKDSKSQQIQQEIVDDVQLQENLKTKSQELPKELKQEPLFKAQTKNEVSTEELVSVKLQNQKPLQSQATKEKADQTLKLLLQGQSSGKNDKAFFTQDFSTATARVIAPQATTESTKSLESLLHGEDSSSSDQEISKNDISSSKILKADSFEIKLNEAKQMTKYLSQDVKQAIDNYKAPFTRVKVQLNPERLGEIELTVVQRGKNLHVNLSSNNAAINALAMNANDLKVQLQNSGINNASLNFNNNSQGQDQAASQQQQQQQNRQDAHSEYNYFEGEEQREEIISSLEIVVPNYA